MVSTLQKEIMLKSTAEADAAAATAAVNAVDEDKWVGSRANLNLGALAIEDRYGDTVRDDFTALKGETPLHYAARAGRLEIVELMLTNVSGQVANVNAATTPAINTGFGMGETPLHYAARHGHVLVCTALLDAAPYHALGKKSTLLCDSPLCRDGVVAVKFTKSRKMPRHVF